MTRTTALHLVGTISAALGYGVGLTALVIIATWPEMGSDAQAYYSASHNVMSGRPLYQLTDVVGRDAYFYPPLFAQLWAPLALLPEPVFVWLWRIADILALRYLAGSWRVMGWMLLVPLTLSELAHANVALVVAGLSLAALRGRSGLAVWAGAWKLGALVLLPFLWLRGRSLMWGLVSVTLACLLSAALAPGAWGEYVNALLFHSGGSTRIHQDIIRILPSVGADFALRFGLAVLVCIYAARTNRPWLAYAAAILAAPTLWTGRFVGLVGVVPLLAPRLR